jgi:thioesterase domain-containing protein
MQQAAGEVLDSIINFSGEAPGILLGYSWAGILAYEVAVQCRRKFNTQPLVILVDTVAPVPRFHQTDILLHILRSTPGWAIRTGPRGWIRTLKRFFIPCAPPSPPAQEVEARTDKPILDHFLRLTDSFKATEEPQLKVHLIRATAAWTRQTPLDTGDIQKSWKDYGWRRTSMAKIHIHGIASNSHLDLLRATKTQFLAKIISGIICKHSGG